MRAVNNPASVSFRRAWLNGMPNCENCLCILKAKRAKVYWALGLGWENVGLTVNCAAQLIRAQLVSQLIRVQLVLLD